MASSPITSWQIDSETVKTVSDFVLGGSKITADGDCSHKIKRCLLLGRKVINNLDSILKSRDITLSTKVHLVKAMVFPLVMYGCESLAIKAENRKIYAFELWCWTRLLRISWTARRSNQSLLKDQSWGFIGRTDVEAEILILLATWCKEKWRRTKEPHLKRPWCWERLRAGEEGDNRGWDSWMVSLTQWTWVWVNSRSWWWTGRPGVLWFMGLGESFPRQVDKKSRGPQGERGLEFSRRKKGQNFFLLYIP